ncbi:LysR substrate-binding domain-containing protein [Parasalinivibrio latis]|uniref:LysR substrate-binding domain-containing protein n=1 Tax=Parasalinivibrio latis TaxID=2952610 RepID=UPI0030E48049
MNIETKWLYDFLTLAELRNFSQAAELRNVTQPAFSRRIKSLENALNAELVDRTKTPVELTPSGKQFRITARSIISQFDEEISRLAGLSMLGGQAVRIAAPHSVATNLLPDFHPVIEGKVPLAALNIEAVDVDDAVEALQQGRCDMLIAFREERLLLPPYQHVHLGRSYLDLVTANTPAGEPLFNAQSKNLPWLSYSAGSYMGRAVEPVRKSLPLQTTFSSSMSDLLKVMVLRGTGVGWLPRYAIGHEISSGRLSVIEQSDFSIPIDIYAYRYESRLPPAGEKVWQALSAEKLPTLDVIYPLPG